MQSNLEKKYVAFISYSHKDEAIAKWLQRKLEAYRLPVEVQENFSRSKYLRPVFRDRSDLGVGVLSEELHANLISSRFLIVVCSPDSARSEWVNREVRTYIELGRSSDIIPFVVGGTDKDECLPLELRLYIKENPEKELLHVDIRENGREEALVRVVSRVLGLGFDQLWKRHVRDKRRKTAVSLLIATVASFAIGWFSMPISLQVSLHDDAPMSLPGITSGVLKLDGASFRLEDLDMVVSCDLPGYKRYGSVDLQIDAVYCEPVDTVLKLRAGLKQNMDLWLVRDDTFAYFSGMVLDETQNPVAGAEVSIEDGLACVTDEKGMFRIRVPLEKQSVHKSVTVRAEGYVDYFREDEVPSEKIVYMMKK